MKTSYIELLKYAMFADVVYGDVKEEKGEFKLDGKTCGNSCNYIINNKYKLISYDTINDDIGAQAMLFKDSKSGEYIYAK